jgi:hypothetical protein
MVAALLILNGVSIFYFKDKLEYLSLCLTSFFFLILLSTQIAYLFIAGAPTTELSALAQADILGMMDSLLLVFTVLSTTLLLVTGTVWLIKIAATLFDNRRMNQIWREIDNAKRGE